MSSTDHDEVVRQSFARQAGLFSGPDSPFAPRPASTLAWIEPLHDDMIVLEVACGTAHASEPVAARVRQVVGIDLTPDLLRIGAARLRENGIPNVLLQEGNAEALPFADESFDVVCCRSSLHHFADPRRAVDEMLRVCRPGGRVVLVDLVAPSETVRDRFDHVHRLLDPSHVRTFCEPELADLFPAGFCALTYGETSTLRLPIDVAITEQSARAEVLALLDAERRGEAPPTGFDPVDEDGKIVVSFTTCIVHAERVAHELCVACGFDGAAYDDRALVAAVRALGPRWRTLLTAAGPELRLRPAPEVWSAIEYAAHSRDITALHAFGVQLAIDDDEPRLPEIDGDELIEQAAATYASEDPEVVATALASEADRLAALVATAEPAVWNRAIVIGDRRNTIRAMVEHALHDSLHHLDDVERGLERLRN